MLDSERVPSCLVVFKSLTSILMQILETHTKVEKQSQICVPYNILPLDLDSQNQAIMRFPEIQAAVAALRMTMDLPWPAGHEEKPDEDMLDFLRAIFGFQKDNVSNQREHLILLLANVHNQQFTGPEQQPRLDIDRALNMVMKKLFENYEKWCKYLDQVAENSRKGSAAETAIHGTHLLIWGEAANLRFLPECLCYIYHHMASELHGVLAGVKNPAYGGEDEAFLQKVVTPIYKTIAQEAKRSRGGKSKHSEWRNYDDLNEYFWSNQCFRLGWPMELNADFFCQTENKPKTGDRWMGKVNFVEIRSFWHIFRSFDRMWSFYILSLQAMIIIACNGTGDLSAIFQGDVFLRVLSIFITAAILNLAQAVLDIALSWKSRHFMLFHVKLRFILKVVAAAFWVVLMPLTLWPFLSTYPQICSLRY